MLMFVEILKLMLGRDSEDEIWSRFMFELVIWLQEVTLARWTQPSGPLCLWQCFHLIACNHALQCDCFWDISTNSIPKGQGWWLWKGLSSANSLQLLFEPWLTAIGGFNRPSWKCNCALFLWMSLKLVWSKVQFFSSSQFHSIYLHAKLKFTWPMLSYNQTAYHRQHCYLLLHCFE